MKWRIVSKVDEDIIEEGFTSKEEAEKYAAVISFETEIEQYETGKPEKMPSGYHGWLLLDGEHGRVQIRELLHNLSARENGEHHDYSKGVLVGVIGTLIACGMTYDDAIQLAWQMCPDDCHPERIPESWRDRFTQKMVS